MYLITPASYKNAKHQKKLWICNGTGAAGSPRWLVRILDSFGGWGINFSPAANIHDWQYFFWRHFWEKLLADLIFFLNMVLLAIFAIFRKPLSRFIGNLIVFPLRVFRASLYFAAVLVFGWLPFYKGKFKKLPGRRKPKISSFK